MNGNDFKEGIYNLIDAAEVVLEGPEENHKEPSQDGAGRDGVPPRNRHTGLLGVAAYHTRNYVMSRLCSCSNMTVTVTQEL